ncbi:MAG: putative DNA-directed RNA polymerase subunit delta [Firmicutes bacterium]|nr:putative DNA-directed RNA polymerase subunit delta [candidate division NPL-UPA2 bacterium]MBT9154324.1 putative DNA-directed RNA polymerase subunit delta [candidate division NPL-UPA2 bacterium]MBT9156379.1 putative DNA-directed RNA polymerase subunit delta [candidate division NPL-UPA2 bacterium]
MNQSVRKTKESFPDIALRLLRERRQATHYKDLIQAVLSERSDVAALPDQMAHILTQINLDARFVHMGRGIWGLRDWAPANHKSTPVVIPGDYLPKAGDYLFDEEQEDDLDDESELIVPLDTEEDETFSAEEAAPVEETADEAEDELDG